VPNTWLRALLGVALLLGAVLPARAQEARLQIRASVAVVRLSVAVVHATGGEIPPLSREDFTVYDNGVRQNVSLLLRPADTTLRVALVLDNSPSLRPWWLTVHRTAVTFLAKLGRSGCPFVLPFSDGIGPGRWGQHTANSWREFLANSPPGGGTSLHDAIIIALEQLAMADELAIEASEPFREPAAEGAGLDQPASAVVRDPSTVKRDDLLAAMRRAIAEILLTRRITYMGDCDRPYMPAATSDEAVARLPEDESVKAVLVLSDGADTTSVASARDAIDAARVANVPIFPVMLGSASRDPKLAALLDEIARATGGFVIRDVAIRDLGAAYDRVLAYLGSTYVLVYNPDEPAEAQVPSQSSESWHEVRVELRRPLLRTIVRPGYYR